MTKEEYKNIFDNALKKYAGNPALLNRVLTSGGEVGTSIPYGNVEKCLIGAKRKNKPTSCNAIDEYTIDMILPDILSENKEKLCEWMADDASDDYIFVNYDGLWGCGYICYPDGTVRMATRLRVAFIKDEPENEFGFSLDGLCCVNNPDVLGPVVGKSM